MSVAIRFEDISKQYRLGEVGTGTLSHDLHRAWAKMRGKPDPFAKVGQLNDRAIAATTQNNEQTTKNKKQTTRNREADYVWALKDIDFDVQEGEILGIIGRNGAGKSTLLKLLSRVTAPTTGSIKAKGRIASLLEVGTGFHPELTGRENIYLNGAILGMRRHEIAKRLEEIVEFSGCAKYIDTPVKRYSSGMTVRLGFAVAAHLDCEILVVDEVLAVGDAEFQKKCIGKMQQISVGSGKTVLFVSHNLESMRQLTNNAIWLELGALRRTGPTESIIVDYESTGVSRTSCNIDASPGKEIAIRSLRVFQGGNAGGDFVYSKPITFRIAFDVNTAVSGAHVALMIRRGGSCILTTGDADTITSRLGRRVPGNYEYEITLPEKILAEATYTVTITAGLPFVHAIDRHEDVLGFRLTDDCSPIREFIHKPHPGFFHLNLDWHGV